ncbi:preprotein translocase subunit SecY [Metamycoplasma equirhinis]|uniref:Protein translocase subunit SecY n=1 Tax=Metamycoplasma equirhinis TaxID=92402 RepID=A0ABZ0PAV5_9BACT|nr:preprotein translocase subunit SecY [Metamycoplasma equirhinis]TPD98300.1 preprotein translocase subunit SecY [Metamycoplasma equirhinis]WPB54137.1 preprotein translocase subunit SecY [Metamycoplasma equirhinis]BDX52579.1 protein translocase subunit SecY [Metamycoplasma equirhinis]
MAKKIKLEKEVNEDKIERKLAIDKFLTEKHSIWTEWWKNHDLFKKILFTLFIITIFLAIGTITIPGINLTNTDKLGQGDFFGILNLVGGGGLRRFSIVALGIGPFISSSLVLMILQTKAFPAIHRLSQSGPQGRIKINFITYGITFAFAIIQALLITKALVNPTTGFGITFDPKLTKLLGPKGTVAYQYFILPMILVAGSFLSLFLSEQITNKGVGNGTSIMIFVGIASALIPTFRQAFEYYMPSIKQSNLVLKEIINYSVYILSYLLTIFIIVIFTIAERHIPIQQVGAGLSKDEKELSFLPIKANPAGIMSVIFAMMVLSVPTMIANLFDPNTSKFHQWVYANFQLTQPLGFFLFILITFGLTILMGIQQSRIDKISEDFAKNSSFIPGVRPGEQTETYLLNIVLRLSFFSTGYLIFLGALQFVQQMFGMPPGIAFGGTSVMILVSTAYETVQQIKARYKSQELARKRRKIRELKEMYGEEEEDLIW